MVTFDFEGKTIHAEDGETVLAALLRSEVPVENRCRVGACQSCLLRSREGAPSSAQGGVDDVLVEMGAFLSCQAPAKLVKTVERLGDDALPRYEARVSAVDWVADDVVVLDLRIQDWGAAPGRFIRLYHPSGVARPYSLATPAWAESGLARLHIRILPDGEMSRLVANAGAGDKFEVEGPFGKCCYRSQAGEEPILLIGSGTGLAPLFAIATDALHQGHAGPIRLYHGGATSDRLYYRLELRQLEREHANFRYIPCADIAAPDDLEGSPLIHALNDNPNLEGFKVYLCGHPQLVKQSQKKCFLAGANLRDIAADPFEAA